ncbi:MAG: chlorite dismutase family protein [Gemmatimonadota bacterium]|nr:chlorite dismutase family protein [Gemmatimonadota bacterium]
MTVSPLFMQLQVFTGCRDSQPVVLALRESGITAAVYESATDPLGVGVVVACREPDELVDRVAPLYRSDIFCSLVPCPRLTMTGRTYLIGYESDHEATLIHRPLEKLLAPSLRWVIWYPLRRSGAFERISADEQRIAMREHGSAGAEFAKSGMAHDIRLSCHGLDANDNDFVIGIAGPELAPLSALVERMRKTVQTSMYLEKLGPFFVGRALWQSAT